MAITKVGVLFLIFAVCDSAFVNTIIKCSIDDEECLKNSYQNSIQAIGHTGVPELDIPAVDPIAFKDINISILGVANITLVKGTAEGITRCAFEKFSLNFETKTGHQEILCHNFIVQGKYKAAANNDIFKQAFGGSALHGDGNLKLSIDKFRLNYDLTFDIKKHDDGETYIHCSNEATNLKYEVLEKVSLEADNIYVGEQDISNDFVKYFNDNWKFMTATFGKPVVQEALDIYIEFSVKFFGQIPTKYYISNDLTQYIN